MNPYKQNEICHSVCVQTVQDLCDISHPKEELEQDCLDACEAICPVDEYSSGRAIAWDLIKANTCDKYWDVPKIDWINKKSELRDEYKVLVVLGLIVYFMLPFPKPIPV